MATKKPAPKKPGKTPPPPYGKKPGKGTFPPGMR